jgi:hypothetical protein
MHSAIVPDPGRFANRDIGLRCNGGGIDHQRCINARSVAVKREIGVFEVRTPIHIIRRIRLPSTSPHGDAAG